MIDLHSVVAFFHKAEWTELAITHEINPVLGEGAASYSTVRKYVRMLGLSRKETDIPVFPESERDFSFDNHIALMLSEEPFFQSTKLIRR
jgi:hypothetical protein